MYDAVLTIAWIASLIGLGLFFVWRERRAYSHALADLKQQVEEVGGDVWIVRMAEQIPMNARIRAAILRSKLNGMLGFLCDECDALVYATEGNFGSQRCPSCGRSTLMLWGRIRTLELEPEVES